MYRWFLRPVLFCFPPETVHRMVISCIKYLFFIPGLNSVFHKLFFVKKSNINIDFAGINFKSIVGLAAGFDKNASVFNEFSSFGFSFVEIGTVTPLPQHGNKKPRSFRLKKDNALINRMGFNNVGADKVVENLKKRRQGNLIIGGNIGKNSITPNAEAINDYAICFEKLYDYVDYFVVNVSCPNISNLSELQDPGQLKKILEKLSDLRKKQDTFKPILLKISPDLKLKEIDEIIRIYHETGIDGIVATNTTIRRVNLKTADKKIINIGSGGLSGMPLTNRSTEIIRYISEKSHNSIPLIAVGGIMTAEDAMEKIAAGARLVQIYTGFIYNGPFLAKKINKLYLQRYN